MFCSKCGKTIRATDESCPSCQTRIGDNRFGGIPYTSAQFTIAPGQELPYSHSFEPVNAYTRTTYTSMDNAAQEEGDADSRTTYRPVYEGGSAAEPVRRSMRAAMNPEPEVDEAEAEAEDAEQAEANQAAVFSSEPLSQAALDSLNELDDELRPEEAIDLNQFRSRTIQSSGRAGISRDVTEYIRKLESEQNRRAERAAGRHRRAAAPIYDDYEAQEPREDDEDYTEEYASEHRYSDQYGDAYGEDGVFEDMDDEDFEGMRRASRFAPGQIIKVVVALVLVAAIAVGVIMWVRHVRGSQSSSPITGVSETLYTQGVELIKSHSDSVYTNELISLYKQNSSILPVITRLEQDKAAIAALLPAEPAANDETFISALQVIFDNISNAVTMDAMAVDNPTADDIARSEANWQIVSSSIAQLESVKEAAELTAIINGQKITVQSETPAPTATPVVYTSLQKGDKSDAVLKLQDRLYRLGYLNDDRDGAFGGKTQTAVKAFQERAGIEATGIADSATQTQLYSDDAPYAAGVASPTPSAQPTPEAQIIEPIEAVQANPVGSGTT